MAAKQKAATAQQVLHDWFSWWTMKICRVVSGKQSNGCHRYFCVNRRNGTKELELIIPQPFFEWIWFTLLFGKRYRRHLICHTGNFNNRSKWSKRVCMIYKGNRARYLNPGQFENTSKSVIWKRVGNGIKRIKQGTAKANFRRMEFTVITISREMTAWCKTDNRCDLDIPICEVFNPQPLKSKSQNLNPGRLANFKIVVWKKVWKPKPLSRADQKMLPG